MSATFSHDGLPNSLKPFDLCDMLERLKSRLQLRDEDIAYLRYAFRQVRLDDFLPGRICALWPSATRLADALGFNLRRLNRIEGRLESRGLILRTSMRNGRRYGRRGAQGQIIIAGGINLGPLINRAEELAEMIRSTAQTMERLRNSRNIANDLIRQIRALGAEKAIQAAKKIFPRLRPSEVQNEARLDEIIKALEAILEDFSTTRGRTDQVAPSDSFVRPDTNKKNKIKTCRPVPTADRVCTTPAQVCLLASWELREVIMLYAEGLEPGLPPSWSSIIMASRDMAQTLGISGRDWAHCCDILGSERAAICLMIVDRNARRTDQFRVNRPAAAFIGMVRKEARQGAVLNALLGELMKRDAHADGICSVRNRVFGTV